MTTPDSATDFDARQYMLATNSYEGVLIQHDFKFSGRVGQLDRQEKDRDPIYSREFGDCRPDIILERTHTGKVLARMIMSYFGSHFTEVVTSPAMLDRYLTELVAAIKKRNWDAMIALDQKWDREKDEDDLEEAWEQPGPDMPGDEPEQPAQPEEPFDPREYMLAGDYKGEERLKWLEKVMAERRGGDYFYVPYTSKGTYSDFDEQANYEYFEREYDFLNAKGELIGFNRYEIEHPRDPDPDDPRKPNFERYLGEIPDDDWDRFKSDVKDVRNGVCMNDDRSNELRMEAENEYFSDNYKDMIDALRDQKWMHNPEFEFWLAAVGKLDADDVATLCQWKDQYPESEGQGSVYLDFDKAAQKVDPDDLTKLFTEYRKEDVAQYKAAWDQTKREQWNAERGVGYLFEKEMREQVAGDPELQRRFDELDSRSLYDFFQRALEYAAEHGGNDFPRWWVYKPGYYDRGDVEHWVLAYPLDSGEWARLDRQGKEDHIAGSMFEFVRDFAIPLLKGAWRTPKEHPELPFTSGIKVGNPDRPSDDVEQYLPRPQQESDPDTFDAKDYLLNAPRDRFNYRIKEYGGGYGPYGCEILFGETKLDWHGSCKDTGEAAELGQYWVDWLTKLDGLMPYDPVDYPKWLDWYEKAYRLANQRGVLESEQPTPEEIAKEAKKAEEPASKEQAEAGNYPKGHVELHGFDISIENAKGSIRKSKDPKKRWQVKMPAHYGYIRGTVGKDKDHIDVYIGEHPEKEKVFVVNQWKDDGSAFDEHKVMLGFENKDEAIETYDKAFSDGKGPDRRKSVVKTDIDGLKEWLKDGNHKAQFPEKTDEALDEPFDAREYLTAEPIEVTDWLQARGFKLVANDTWQWEDDQHMVMVTRNTFRNGDVWEVYDGDVEGQERRYRWAWEDDAVPFLRLLRNVQERKPVTEAAQPPAPVPAPPEDEFDPREYFVAPADAGKLVKDTPTMRVIKPAEETVERFIHTNAQGASNTRVIQVNPMYMVIPKDGGQRFLIGVWEDGTLYTPPFGSKFTEDVLRTKSYSKDLRRFFRSHAVRYMNSDDEDQTWGLRMLAQLYGPKVVLKYLDRYEAPDDLKMKLGIDAAKRNDLSTAAKLLNHPAKLLNERGVAWELQDWDDLSQFFERQYQRGADSILSGEPVDAHWIYDKSVKPEVTDVLRHIDAGDYKTIRELLPHRTIYPYDDGQAVMLTSKILQEFDDDDIAYWLGTGAEDVDPEGELQDIRDALVNAACYAWEQVTTDDWFEGYKKSALDAIDASAEWKNGRLEIFVEWTTIEKWLDDAEDRATDIDDLLYNYSPRAEPSDDYSTTSWDESGSLSEYINDQLAELDMPPYPYDPNQMTMPDVLGPDPEEYLNVKSYSKHTPHGWETKMKRKDVERWQREEPWRLDREKWREYARQQNIEIPPEEVPPAPSVGESLADQLLEKEYKYATTQVDVPAPQSDFIFEWGRANIPDDRLYFGDPNTNPRETEQHITVLYGLTVNDVPDELRQITEGMKPFPVYIGKVSLFRQETHDVVKLDVESPWLRKLNAQMRSVLPNENKHPDYVPHITIAYVDKGSCDDLEGRDIFQGQPGAVDPQFVAYGLVFKGAGDDQGNRVRETLLFTRVKKAPKVESEPFAGVPFPLDPEHTGQFLRLTRNRAKRTIL